MQVCRRRTTPRVVHGKVRRKNRDDRGRNYSNTRQVAVRRERPEAGYRHVLTPGDITVFINLLPQWDELAIGLDTILLARGSWYCDGWHVPGTVAVCAWEAGLVRTMSPEYHEDHSDIFRRLHVPCRRLDDVGYVAEFSEWGVRSFQLLHILLHELGHHHDRMTSPSRKRATRGERYAEAYARTHEQVVWSHYLRTFGGHRG
jgi:hypothetical protein